MQGTFSLSQSVAVFRRVWSRFVGITFLQVAVAAVSFLFSILFLSAFSSWIVLMIVLIILIVALSFFIVFSGYVAFTSVFVHDGSFLESLSFGIRNWYRILVPVFLSSSFVFFVAAVSALPFVIFSSSALLTGFSLFLYLIFVIFATASFVFLPFVWIERQDERSFTLLGRSFKLAWRRHVFLPLVLILTVFFAISYIPDSFDSTIGFLLAIPLFVFLLNPFFFSCIYVLYLSAKGDGEKRAV